MPKHVIHDPLAPCSLIVSYQFSVFASKQTGNTVLLALYALGDTKAQGLQYNVGKFPSQYVKPTHETNTL